ncbi:unnamed protein product [Spirodela intermedia]|uniref:Uncharacterized protein n=1 Tax=Spirodela intermedia TaxID=51605 RepID=A0A7I8IT13_SPIIN|nr:unnamed protein product [Spirodela intermedia]CAA6660094.1 unnamed protein product [Spirodela intermedia]
MVYGISFSCYGSFLSHAGRASAAAAGFEKGIDPDLEPFLSTTHLS